MSPDSGRCGSMGVGDCVEIVPQTCEVSFIEAFEKTFVPENTNRKAHEEKTSQRAQRKPEDIFKWFLRYFSGFPSLLTFVLIVEGCDARDDDRSNAAGPIKLKHADKADMNF